METINLGDRQADRLDFTPRSTIFHTSAIQCKYYVNHIGNFKYSGSHDKLSKTKWVKLLLIIFLF